MTEPQLVGYTSNGRPASNNSHSEGNGKPLNGKVDEKEARPESSGSDKDGEKKKEGVKMVGVLELFRFSDCLDRLLMAIGTLAACCHGAAVPLTIIIFGDMIDSFVKVGEAANNLQRYLRQEGVSIEEFMVNSTIQSIIGIKYNYRPPAIDLLEDMKRFAIYYIIIACVVIFVGYLQVSMWAIAAERQTKRIRIKFFRNILRQEIGWFDTHEAGELNTRLSDDVNKIREGVGDKNGSFFQWFASFLAGFIIGFVKGWKLTLVIVAVSPLLAIAAVIMAKLATSMTSLELKAYAKAGAVADEVLGAIRTVVAFGGQEKECERYNKNLLEARDTGIKKSLFNGLGMGFIWLVVFGSYALGFWYGSELIHDPDEDYSPGKLLIVFFSVLIGAFSLGNAAPSLQSMSTGRGAAYAVYTMIDQEPTIDSSSDLGQKPQNVAGNIEFRNVRFTYPSRPDTQVLNGLSFKVAVGQTVALVGASGCGKSTTVQLLQRFYDPSEGEVMVDGTDIRMLNVRALRENIGVVSQEPVLFATTIAENIRYGQLDISQQQIEEVAKQANAHNFIMELPNKYETLVGERGSQLSGGQKQRVAIARALTRNPKVLLLDEATSALDMESEAIVQEALEKASHGRTTLVIAHRLSTVRGADMIVGIQEGRVVEQGTHDELMEIEGGVYSNLVLQQTKDVDERDEFEEFEAELEKPLSPKRELKRMTSAGSVNRASVKGRKDAKEEEEEEKLPDPPMKRVMRLNSPEWFFILCGCLAALVNGGVQPAFAIVFAEVLGTWSKPPKEQPPLIMMYSLILLGLGVLSFITMFLQGYLFGKSGECLTMRIRQMGFRAMLRQEIAWYDDHRNSTGALTTRLATDASQVQGTTGARIGGVVQSIANMGTAIVIAFVYGWKLALVILAFFPVIAVAGFLQMKILTGVGGKDKEALEDAGKVASEAIENIRTVACLTREPTFHEIYVSKISQPYRASVRNAHMYGVAFGFSQAVIFFAYAASFYFGAYLIKEGEMEYTNVFKVFSAIVFGAMGLGQASAFAPDYAKAKVSAARLFALFDRTPEIDSASEDGQKLQEGYRSAVTFEAVKFNYPTRPTVTVLNGLDISVNPGQTLALVGGSGCGKSTTVSLIERFYDPLAGQVYLDQQDIRELNIKWLRQQIGIVSQEPVLFDSSIAENIAYGDNTRQVPMDEIIAAARGANIHNFIQSLPEGYETCCGDKGTQLSGGQKQRVAIARALVRNPKILLLDEATSALDAESENVVQEALDKAREGRTCVVIAHRLSTIQNADKICVIHHGHVVEEGVHSELMAKQGFYYRLQKIQQNK